MNVVLKVFLVGVFLISSQQIFSQPIHGFRGGLNLSRLVTKYETGKVKEDFWIGVQAAYSLEIPFNEFISLETGVAFESKGTSDDLFGFNSSTISLYYIDIPVVARGGYTFGKVRVVGLVGPYLGFGIFGYSTYDGAFDDFFLFTEDEGLRPIDFGITAGVGVEINRLEVLLEFPSGIYNIARYSDPAKILNRTISLTVGIKGKSKS